MPGKVPRGSLQRRELAGFTPLIQAILDKLDRGVVLLDSKGRVVDSNAVARSVLAIGNGLMVRNDRLAFADGRIDGRFDQLLKSDGNYAAGTYTVPTLGRYWTMFGRTHPLDGPAREQAWSGTVHGLFAELGVGATSFSALQMGQAMALIAMMPAPPGLFSTMIDCPSASPSAFCK